MRKDQTLASNNQGVQSKQIEEAWTEEQEEDEEEEEDDEENEEEDEVPKTAKLWRQRGRGGNKREEKNKLPLPKKGPNFFSTREESETTSSLVIMFTAALCRI